MALENLRNYLDRPELSLPIGDRVYVIGPCTANARLRLFAVLNSIEAMQRGTPLPDDMAGMDEIDLFRLSLGVMFDELADSVSLDELRAAGLTACYWQLGNPTVAEAMWQLAGKVQAAMEPPTPEQTVTGEANTTKRPASGSGTSTRKTPKGKPPAKSSPGRSSSNAGTSSKRTSTSSTASI